MNQIAIRKDLSMPTANEMQNFISIANVLGTCPYYAKMGAGGVLAIWLAARELGLPPMLCLNKGMHVIEGCVTMSAQLMNMMIVNAGHRADVLYLTHEGCKIRFIRSDREKGQGDTFDYEFKMDDALRAGYFGLAGPNGSMLKKAKDNWMNTPRDMFYSRCLSGGARKFMPDILMNCYAIGEMPGDDDLKAAMPDVKAPEMPMLSSQLQEHAIPVEHQAPTQNLQAAPVKAQGHDEFIARHELATEGSPKLFYLRSVMAACEKQGKPRTFEQMVNGALKDENRFLNAYHEWELKRMGPPKITPSADVATTD